MRTRVHVNGHNIRLNKKDGGERPVFTVKDYKRNRKTNRAITFTGPVTLFYKPDAPLKSGAVAWMETDAPVIVEGAA